jgi:hypothetical protein
VGSFGVDLVAALLEFDHLLPEGERLAAIEGDQLHAENFGIKINRGVETGDGEDEVVERIHGDSHIRGMILDPGQRPARFCGAGGFGVRLSLGSRFVI